MICCDQNPERYVTTNYAIRNVIANNFATNACDEYPVHYVNVPVLIKFSQNTSVLPNYHKFSIKSYVLGVY